LKGREALAEPVFAVLDPRAEELERERRGLNPRLDTLEGKTVNVINLHGGNEEAFASIATDLKDMQELPAVSPQG